ncbi:hypothetical protein ABFP33_11295 [Acinetobacter bereziniae]|uniref:hypothetical protein n=1 Tax=Acinetobacter bereziniae TaxID=106648 RepID=UPI003215A23B
MAFISMIVDWTAFIWKMLGSSSNQIQIGIALVALVYAFKAYKKVLKQIDISNRQTDLSLKQTQISLQQMDRLNKERIFELRLRLKIRIGEYSNALMELQDVSNNLSSRLNILSIDTKDNHPGSIDAIEGMINDWRESITSAWDVVGTKLKENNDYLERIATTIDIVFMEDILDKVEQNQLAYQAKMRELRNLDEHVTKVWMPMNMGVMEAARTMHNFK